MERVVKYCDRRNANCSRTGNAETQVSISFETPNALTCVRYTIAVVTTDSSRGDCAVDSNSLMTTALQIALKCPLYRSCSRTPSLRSRLHSIIQRIECSAFFVCKCQENFRIRSGMSHCAASRIVCRHHVHSHAKCSFFAQRMHFCCCKGRREWSKNGTGAQFLDASHIGCSSEYAADPPVQTDYASRYFPVPRRSMSASDRDLRQRTWHSQSVCTE